MGLGVQKYNYWSSISICTAESEHREIHNKCYTSAFVLSSVLVFFLWQPELQGLICAKYVYKTWFYDMNKPFSKLSCVVCECCSLPPPPPLLQQQGVCSCVLWCRWFCRLSHHCWLASQNTDHDLLIRACVYVWVCIYAHIHTYTNTYTNNFLGKILAIIMLLFLSPLFIWWWASATITVSGLCGGTCPKVLCVQAL